MAAPHHSAKRRRRNGTVVPNTVISIYEVITMLDIKRIKEDPDKVKAGLRAKEVN